MKKILIALVFVLAVMTVAHATTYTTWEATPTMSTVGPYSPSTTGTVVTVAASSTALVNLFSGLANDTTHTHVLIRVKNGTNVYFNGTVATPSLGLAFTSSDGLWKLPLTPEVKAFTLTGDAGTETVNYMAITEE